MSSFLDYSTAGQTSNNPLPISSTRNPTTHDVIAPDGAPYNVGRNWVNTVTQSIYQYAGGGVWVTGTGLQSTVVTLTSTQIKALNVTPITLIAAQGFGKSILISNAQAKFIYGGTSAFTAAEDLTFQYAGVSGQIIGTIAGGNFLDQTSSQYQPVYMANTIAPVINVENQPIVIYNNSGSPITGNAAGDNKINITTFYTVLTQ